MPQASQRAQSGGQSESRVFAEIFFGVIRVAVLTIEVFLHRNFGESYPGCGLFGFILIAIFSYACQPQNTAPLFWFAVAYGIFWLIAETNMLIRWWRGNHNLPARYNGYPHLCRLLPDWKEVNVKVVEALLAIGAGFVIGLLSAPLGLYILIASTLMLLRAWGYAARLRNRAIELNDSVLEETLIAERFREMQQR